MSPQKHAAQIANASRSHGPVTESGRLRSSSNSVRHGLASRKLRIIPPEDREEFDRHCSEMLPALAPEGPIENHLADLIVFDEWRLIRTRGLENEIFAMGFTTAKDHFFAGAETWAAKSKELATLTLYEQRISRVLSRNKAEFESRQSARKSSGAGLPAYADSHSPAAPLAQSDESQPEPATGETSLATREAVEPAVGFVRSSAAAAAVPEPLTIAAGPPDTTALEPGIGFVRSTAAASPAPDPLDLELAAPAFALAATPGFVRSSATASPVPIPDFDYALEAA